MDTDRIQMAHGGGGQLTADLLEGVILPALGKACAYRKTCGLPDAAPLHCGGRAAAFTTDSYVVQPLEFPGGDIGRLAICGTVNDLAVSGAEPRWISLALVMEEGLEIALLQRVLRSAGLVAGQAGVRIVTGDTKVVQRSGIGGLIINTAGVGPVRPKARLGFARIRTGDRVVLSGPLGEHGLAVMMQREGLSLTSGLKSDCAPLGRLAGRLVESLGADVRFLRDPTRGGLAATLADASAATGRNLEIQERAIPVNPTALAAAELLGLDLLTAANEGKLVAVVAARSAGKAVKILSRDPIARRACVIGQVGPVDPHPLVEIVTAFGGRRIIQMPYGEDLPRIC